MSDSSYPPPPPPPPPPLVSPTELIVPSTMEQKQYWTSQFDGKQYLVPRGLQPDNIVRSRALAEEHGADPWVDDGRSPYMIGGPLWAPPRPAEEYPVVEGMPICDVCNLQHVTLDGKRSCTAHRKIPGGKVPCRKPPMHEQKICGQHGGRTAAGKKGVRRRLAEAEAARTLAEVNVTPIGNPIDHLQDLAAEALALKDHFADVVAELREIGSPRPIVNDEGEIVFTLNGRDEHGYRFTDDKGTEQLDARVALYERALDRAEKFLTNLVKLDFEEKRIRLDEARVLLMMDFTRYLVKGLGRDVSEPEVEALIRGLAPILDGLPPVIEVEESEAEAEAEARIG